MLDTAVVCGADPVPTVVYWPGTEHPSARFDQIWATPDLGAALVSHDTIADPQIIADGESDGVVNPARSVITFQCWRLTHRRGSGSSPAEPLIRPDPAVCIGRGGVRGLRRPSCSVRGGCDRGDT
jgi:hypothetical protein